MIPNVSQAMHQFYDSGIALDHVVVNPVTSAMGVDAFVVAKAKHGNHSNTLLYCLALLKEKVHQIQSLVGILVSPEHHHHRQPGHPSMSAAVASMGNLIQEVIMTASSMMFTCQQLMSATIPPRASSKPVQMPPQGMFDPNEGSAGLDWYADSNNFVISCGSNQNSIAHDTTCNNNNSNSGVSSICTLKNNNGIGWGNTTDYDVIEPDASQLLAKYTHYCKICGKGFKRDANLRMHMRAHGDEYKCNSALRNTMKNGNNGDKDQVSIKPPTQKYSCPQEGCRWNQKHAKFQPLKSMICIKNHYKRCHCPKMYVCKKCNRKQFSVLSDLRTHEKHCGNLKWQCSCGTTFSRKDKLIGHVTLFAGHTPVVNISKPATRVDRNQLTTATSMQIEAGKSTSTSDR